MIGLPLSEMCQFLPATDFRLAAAEFLLAEAPRAALPLAADSLRNALPQLAAYCLVAPRRVIVTSRLLPVWNKKVLGAGTCQPGPPVSHNYSIRRERSRRQLDSIPRRSGMPS